MSSSLTDLDPAERLRRDTARRFLDSYPGVLRGTDVLIAEAHSFQDTELANKWLDFRAGMEHLAELSEDVLGRVG